MLNELHTLALEVQQGTYKPSRSVCFITCQPKMREIFAAAFRDRIVHHLVVRELEKVYEPVFIFDSYASRKGKGIHEAVKRLQGFMLKASKSGKVPAYFLQLDIRSFFMNIDRNILFGLLERKLDQKDVYNRDCLLYLLHRIIFHDCCQDFVLRGNSEDLKKIPAHKSLFKSPSGKALPIGNLPLNFWPMSI